MKVVYAALALAALKLASADEGQEALRQLEKKEIGISVSGIASSRFQQSALSGDSARLGQPSRENAAYSQAEIDLSARPSESARGRLLFRVHQDWENYYDQGPNPLVARWFDFNGELFDDHVHYALGDFLAKHSPLTLYAPAPELLDEPDIFADRRQSAMGEFFLGDNRLPLQGIDAAFDRDWIPSTLGLSADVAGARLRSVFAGPSTWEHWTDDVEKWAATSTWKLRLFDAAKLGFAQTYVIDNVDASRAKNNSLALAQKEQLPQTLYEDDYVNAFSLDLDAARWLKDGKLKLSLETEYALSDYKSTMDDSTPQKTVVLKNVEELKGTAARADLKAAFGAADKDAWSVSADLGYLNNDKNFVSDLAQSPTFIGRRILNSQDAVGGPMRGYSTLDALYNHLYAIDPITSLNNSEQWHIDSKYYNGTNNWYRAPFLKNSYGYYTTTKSERDSLIAAGGLDPHVQLLFPFGPATPNRSGVTAQVNASLLSGALSATAVFAALKEVEGEAMDSLAAAPADLGRMGGGLRLEAAKLLKLPKPLSLSGSYVAETRKRAAFASKGVSVSAEDFQSTFVNAGLTAGVWKGLSLLAGYQRITSNPVIGSTQTPGARALQAGDLTEDQWSLGLEVKITHGAYVTAEYGRLGFDEAVTKTQYAQDLGSLSLVIQY